MDKIPPSAWIVLAVVIVVLLAVDLFIHRGERAPSHRGAIIWAGLWIAVGLAYNVYVWIILGGQAAQEYLAAYLLEESLSLDNLFVFYVIFKSLNIPERYQHNVLFWGIFGAIVFRAIFIFLGVSAVSRWQWITIVFGVMLLFAAWQSYKKDPSEQQESKIAKWLERRLPVTTEVHGHQFMSREQGKRVATPLLLALVAIELSDIMFAIDSVPAAFSVTQTPYIIYSANLFAILGLRALYIAMAQGLSRLKYLHYGLAAVLGFAGIKLILDQWIHIPALASVAIIVIALGLSVWASLRAGLRDNTQEAGGESTDAAKDDSARSPR